MIYVILFIFGLVFGSFYNVVGLRLSKVESIVFPPSHCMNCNHRLHFFDLIPLFSYLFLKGKCRYCSKHISIKYPLFELLTAILFCTSYLKFGYSIETIISIILCSMLVIITVSDLDSYIIPDSVLIICSILIFGLYFYEYKTIPLNNLLNGIASFIFMFLIKMLGNFILKKESMGDGDIKLMAVVGMVIGFKKVILSLFLASYLGLPYAIYIMVKKNVNHELPFGPFLSLASLILLFVDIKIF